VGSKLEELRVQAKVVVNSLEVARLAARRGHGVTWLPETLAREDVERAELVAVLKKFWLPPVPFQLVYPSARHLAPQVRAAIELLVERLKEAP
jgi:DNA-binding transcriptional LysR family regulator